MARVTIQDCRMVVPNQFLLCLKAAERARELNESTETSSIAHKNVTDKPTVLALREIAEGYISTE